MTLYLLLSLPLLLGLCVMEYNYWKLLSIKIKIENSFSELDRISLLVLNQKSTPLIEEFNRNIVLTVFANYWSFLESTSNYFITIQHCNINNIIEYTIMLF